MTRHATAPLSLALALTLGLAGCETVGLGDSADETAAAEASAEPTAGAATPDAAAGTAMPAPGTIATPERVRPVIREEDVREIYLAVEGADPATASVVFAIDQNRNGDPSDDRALRLSPENNQCNPQEMTRFAFKPGTAPVFGVAEAQRGVTPANLPRFMAAQVTEAMTGSGIAATREDTFAQNICTRKLWEQIVLNRQAQVQAEASGQR